MVGEYLPWLSDHCIISTTICIENFSGITKTSKKGVDLHPGFIWNDNEFEKYKEALTSPMMNEKVNNVLSNNFFVSDRNV